MTDVLLGALILVPVLLTFMLKSDAALGFLALSTGFVLSTSVIGDLKELLNQMNLSVTDTTIALVLISTPLVLTLLLTRKAHSMGLMLGFSLVAALAAGGLLALSVVPLIGDSAQFNLSKSEIWPQLQSAQAAIIGVGGLLSLLLVWTSHIRKHSSKAQKIIEIVI